MLLIIVFLLLLVILNLKKGLFESGVRSILVFSFSTVFITESLSFFKWINVIGVYITWSTITLFCLYLVYKNKNFSLVIFELKKLKTTFQNNFSKIEKGYVLIIFIFLFLLFLQGILYPPNNWDSLTYHMSRIMFWIGNESVNHFPSHILRHLYQPPFAEFVIMNVNLLNGNDYFSNSVQLLFLLASLFVVWEILSMFDFSRRLKLLALLLLISIPTVILQATNTKNDIIAGFFILCSILYLFKIYRNPIKEDFIYLGFTIGLGMLTKGTAYLFFLPVFFAFGMLFLKQIFIEKNFFVIKNLYLVVVIVLAINFSHFQRNYSLNRNVLNIDVQEAKNFSNENLSLKTTFSSFLKNVALHVPYPLNEPLDKIIHSIHDALNIDINSQQNNYLGIKYSKPYDFTTHEDYVPNFIHLLLILGAILVFVFHLKRKKDNKTLLYNVIMLIIIMQLLLFAFYLKWQPWHTRLHIPIFMSSSILVVCSLALLKRNIVIQNVISVILIGSTFLFIIFNNLRPLIENGKLTKNISLSDSRFEKYFANQPQLYGDYKSVVKEINSNETIGLIMSDWEYPLFYNYYFSYIKPVAINVNNITSKARSETPEVNSIVSNTINQAYIDYDGKRYFNISTKNSYLWIYSLNK